MPLWDGHFLIVGKCSEGKVRNVKKYFIHAPAWNGGPFQDLPGGAILRATPHNSRLTAQAPLRRLRHGICVAKMLDNVGLRYPHRASGAKAPRTLRPLPLLRFAVSATGGAHLCSIQYYLRFWPSSCRTSLAVSALRIMRYCPKSIQTKTPRRPAFEPDGGVLLIESNGAGERAYWSSFTKLRTASAMASAVRP